MRCLSRRLIVAASFGLPAIALLRAPAVAGNAATDREKRVGLGGHDPVSYFTDGRPEKGLAEFSAEFDDALYLFRSAEHRAMFVDDPDRYAPQFAGFCAVTVARGEKAEADPQAWIISDGKLFVFRGPQGVDRFRQQAPVIIGDANANWPSLRGGR